jgi:hypothetical protein
MGGTVATPRNIASLNATPPMFGDSSAQQIPAGLVDPIDYGVSSTGKTISGGVATSSGFAGTVPSQVVSSPMASTSGSASIQSSPVSVPSGQMSGGQVGGMTQAQSSGIVQPSYNMPAMNPAMYGGMMGGMMPMGNMGGMPAMAPANQQNYNREYQDFDFVSEGIEPCIIPYIVGYDSKGVTIYGNMMERYATMDRYKFLLTTNNNALYDYIETKQSQIQTPEQIISDLHIRYIKNAMAKSGLSTLDSNLSTFDYKGDVRRFLSQYVPQNLIDMVISDYNELLESIDFNLLKDLIEHKFQGDLENYIPEDIKTDVIKSTNMIASVAKVIMSDAQIRKTYEAYSRVIRGRSYQALSRKKMPPEVMEEKKEAVKKSRDHMKKALEGLQKQFFYMPAEVILEAAKIAEPAKKELVELTLV